MRGAQDSYRDGTFSAGRVSVTCITRNNFESQKLFFHYEILDFSERNPKDVKNQVFSAENPNFHSEKIMFEILILFRGIKVTETRPAEKVPSR